MKVDIKALIKCCRADRRYVPHLQALPEPVIAADEVLIEIRAAGLNQPDHKILTGSFKLILPYKPPFVLGHDLAGVVKKIGARVTRFNVGDEVISRPSDHRIGTFAEYLAVRESDIAMKPANLGMEEAAALPLVALMAWQVLVEAGKLKKGRKVFIQAGSGGVGLIAIQLAKHLGATVATTASKGSFGLLRSLGADVLIDYKTQDFGTLLNGYDLVLNSQDDKALEKSLNIVRKGGTVISISGPPTPAFARKIGTSWIVKLATALLSYGIRRKAKREGSITSSYSCTPAAPNWLRS